MNIQVFGVIGAGQMGNGIAQVAAMSGLDVIMNDISEEFVQRGLSTITKNLDRAVGKGGVESSDRWESRTVETFVRNWGRLSTECRVWLWKRCPGRGSKCGEPGALGKPR